MSAKQYRKARAQAYETAQKQDLWIKGKEEVTRKWYRKVLWKLWKPFRTRWEKIIARWYRSNLKRWSHEVVASNHDRDAEAFKALQKKVRKARMKRQLRNAERLKAESEASHEA